jgi:UDP:flavonoid glycosyltransferase YjiC (YdhE family)
MSLQEAITRGEPLVGIPVFAVQSVNMARAVLAGYGLIIDCKIMTREFFKLVYSRSI